MLGSSLRSLINSTTCLGGTWSKRACLCVGGLVCLCVHVLVHTVPESGIGPGAAAREGQKHFVVWVLILARLMDIHC